MSARPSQRLLLLAAVLAALLGLAVSRFGGTAPASHSAAPGRDAATACSLRAGTTTRVSVPVEGLPARSALVHVPRVRHGRLTLILALHGAYGNGAFMEGYSGLSKLADRDGFAVVYPDAAGPMWRIGASEDGADVQFLDALIDRLMSGGCFDARRVSAVGVSNGAGMAARFACAGDDRLAGLVAVAGAYGPLPACNAHRPLSVLEIHGTADAVVPYNGTPQDPQGGVLTWLHGWTGRDACSSAPRQTWQRAGVLRLDWRGCLDGTSVEHLRLDGGTHAWPGADPPDPGPKLGVSAAQEAWNFLRGRSLATGVAAEHNSG
jgi:polyhydroxybutyrate depolymerase